MDFHVVEMVGEAFGIPIDNEMPERRVECAEILREAGAVDEGK